MRRCCFDLLVDLTEGLWVVSGNITWYGEGLEASILLESTAWKRDLGVWG